MQKRTMTNKKLELTELGFGGAGIGNILHSVSMQKSEAAVSKAWDIGVRFFDTAPHYGAGLSERRLGCALHDVVGAAAANTQVVTSTKVGRMLSPLKAGQQRQDMGFVNEAPFIRTYDYSYDAVMRSFEDSTQRLGVEKIDVLFMHDIGKLTHGDDHADIFKTAMDSGYRAMDELRSQGLVKSIGLGVNEWQVCDQTLEHAEFDCFMVANCFTLLDNQITDTFIDKCDKKAIDLIVAAPFNSGILASGSERPSAYFYGAAPKETIQRTKELEAVCKLFGVSLGAAAIQYPLTFNLVKSVVIGMAKPHYIDTNYQWYKEDIPAEFWQALVNQNLVNRVGLI